MLEPYEHKLFGDYKPRRNIHLESSRPKITRFGWVERNRLYDEAYDNERINSLNHYNRRRGIEDYNELFVNNFRFGPDDKRFGISDLIKMRLRQAIGHKDKVSILEIGPGLFNFVRELQAELKRDFGPDIIREKLDYDAITKDDVVLDDVNARAISIGNAEDIQTKEKYDFIIDVYAAMFYLDRFTRNKLLLNWVRSLKPGGVLFIADIGPHGFLDMLIEHLKRTGYYVVRGNRFGLLIIKPPLSTNLKDLTN